MSESSSFFDFKIMEEWIDVKGYEGLYKLSTVTWRVKSLKTMTILKEYKAKSGHAQIGLNKGGERKTFNISRIVGITLLGLDVNDSELYVCHKSEELSSDGFLNNSVENLFLGTHQDNMRDMAKKGRAKGVPGLNSKVSVRVKQFSKEGDFIKTWESMSEVKRTLGISQGTIGKCCNGTANTAGGFIWRKDKGSRHVC